MAYIEPQHIQALVQFLAKSFPLLAMLDYDMVNPHDPFGKMMLQNFKHRGIPLKGMDFFSSLANIKSHYEQQGFAVEIHSMRDMYYSHLDQEERRRIEKLEFLDEFEEFVLMMQHYFMSLSKRVQPAENGQIPAEHQVIARLSLTS